MILFPFIIASEGRQSERKIRQPHHAFRAKFIIPRMEIHTYLASDVAAFDFTRDDFRPLERELPRLTLRVHQSQGDLLDAGDTADCVLTWVFDRAWYPVFPNLRAVLTPAAGADWVAPDPTGRVRLIHGTFHGPLLAESLLGAILFMNRRMPDMLRNFGHREWNRNIQKDCRLLAHQTVVIVGLGHIGTECARVLRSLDARVIGIKRDPATLPAPLPGVDVRPVSDIDKVLPEADHVVVILPGGADTDRILDQTRLRLCKPGVFVYNFGRGNAVAGEDIVKVAGHIGGAFLDVTDQEPLPPESPLWSLDNVMITPHSSCVYREYRAAFIDEVAGYLSRMINEPA